MKSDMRFIKSALEYRTIDEVSLIPKYLRGIYALYQLDDNILDLVYIGMSGKEQNGRIRSRLQQHTRGKSESWTHFSYYEVWDNVTELEIKELEGLFRQLYRFSVTSNSLNRQQTHRPLVNIRKRTENELGVPSFKSSKLGL
jgi:hypothetical protein